MTISIPNGSARVARTAAVWANRSASTTTRALLDLRLARLSSVIASAAAVASSSIDELATSIPVRSETMV